jgi:hypothetical protein
MAEQTVPAYGGNGGKAPIVPLGQTAGSYGNEPTIKREYGGESRPTSNK